MPEEPAADAYRSTPDLVSLAGRTAVVTGAARGLGQAMARRLTDAGASVLVADLDGDAAVETVARISAGDPAGRALAAIVDVADRRSVAAAADRAMTELGGLDVWVNNAGIFPTGGPILDMDDGLAASMLSVNYMGTLHGAREAAQRMSAGGVIVNVSSSSAFRAGAGVAVYASIKAGVAALTRNLAVELGPRGIRVLAVAPHIVDTPGTRREADALAAAGASLTKLARANPLRLEITPDHIARSVLFAASDLSAGMTGSTLLVDAGVLA
jgi:NAD(P)-dependent dehydrogenase (short-subunit alcohol dehydrogenase family)